MSFEPLKDRASFDLSLKYPFKFDGIAYQTLSFRRPRQGELTAMSDGKGGAGERLNRMLASLASVPPDVIAALDPEDTAEVNAWLMPILDPKGLLSKAAGS